MSDQRIRKKYVELTYSIADENGESKVFVVTAIDDEKLTVDGNHPMAGKTVTFNLTIVSVRDATLEEINGQTAQSQPSLH